MGYYIRMEESTFSIPADKLDEALERLKALNHKPGVEKNGGSYSGGRQTAKWFSWMDEKYDEKVTSAAEVFEQLGFEVEYDDDGALILTEYDSKIGQESLFLQEVSDLAPEGWYVEFTGEDGARFRYTAEGEKQAKIIW